MGKNGRSDGADRFTNKFDPFHTCDLKDRRMIYPNYEFAPNATVNCL